MKETSAPDGGLGKRDEEVPDAEAAKPVTLLGLTRHGSRQRGAVPRGPSRAPVGFAVTIRRELLAGGGRGGR